MSGVIIYSFRVSRGGVIRSYRGVSGGSPTSVRTRYSLYQGINYEVQRALNLLIRDILVLSILLLGY